MLKRSMVVVWLVAVGCGDNSDDRPPQTEASEVTVTVGEDGTVTIDASATDADGDNITYSASKPAHGTLSGTPPRYTYTPDADFTGKDMFVITVSDGRRLTSVPVTVTVNQTNDAPVASAGTVTTNQNQGVAIKLAATDVDSTTLSYEIVAQPTHGLLTGQPPNLTYTPALHYVGTDSFTFKASDGQLGSNVATVSITVSAVTTCGDGRMQGAEQCDDGNADNTDGCLNNCMIAACGDGATQAGVDQCDDGNGVDTDACLNTCKLAACGDGVVQADVEQCDLGDGNSDNGACLSTCKIATCGDGFVEIGTEQCDLGDGNSDTGACLTSCHEATCGDGFTQTGVEACDDGNTSNTDVCLNSCAIAGCGDGFVEAGVEACDDGNQSNNDACLNTCAAAGCGDGFVEIGIEQCDLGVGNSNNGACTAACNEAVCGDGLVQVGVEQCDDGNPGNNDACLNTCANATCGDGFVEVGVEQCDDANGSNADACLTTCVESVCGDGFVEAGVEQCDDGNTNNDDGCRNDCTAPQCGDGTLGGGEECDDGNKDDDDGCGHSCKIERCGDGLVQFSRGEECDDRNTVSGDGCDSNCLAEPFTTTSPVLISDALNCTTAVATSTHRVAVDSDGRIYAGFTCGSAGYVAISTDRGQTFSTPTLLSVDAGGTQVQVSQIAIGTGEVGTAYAALLLTSGAVTLRTTNDFGTSWGSAVAIGTASNTSSGLALQAFNDDLFVGFAVSGGVSVARSPDQGASFTSSLTNLTIAFFDLAYDVRQRTLSLTADTPTFHVRISTDMGQSFAAEVNPPGQEFFSDWTMANGRIFVSGINVGSLGNSTKLYVIPTGAPTTSTAISGLPQVTTSQSRSLTSDAVGNAYVSSTRNGGGVQLDRLPSGGSSLDPPRSLSATGTHPNAAPLPGDNGVVVIYTEGTQVWATVQSYAPVGGGGIPGG